MKIFTSIVFIVLLALVAAAPADEEMDKPDGDKPEMVCRKYDPINATPSQVEGEWTVVGYGFNGQNDHPDLKCQKRNFKVNPDGETGIIETSNIDPATNKLRTFTQPFFGYQPGVGILGKEPGSDRVRSLTVLHIDDNVLAYHLLTSNCGSGEQINEPRIAVRNAANAKKEDLVKIMESLPSFADFKDFHEIPHDNCQ